MTCTEQFEHEAAQTRSQIADTLDELRACMTPAQLLNQIALRVGEPGGPAFVTNLKRQAINNPVPLALIAAGLAWLMLGALLETKARAPADDFAEKKEDAAADAIAQAAS